MGYLTGRICNQTQEEAQNAIMSQIVPTIDANGVLNYPIYNGSTWTFKGSVVSLKLPECEYGQYANLGFEAGQAITQGMAIVFMIAVLLKALKMI